MKSKYVILAPALLISVIAFAQKDQLKAAEKSLKAGDFSEVITILKSAEPLISNASDSDKAQYYFVNAKAHLELANKKVDEGINLTEAGKSFQEIVSIEKASGKDKYTSQAISSIIQIKNKLLNSAIADTKEHKVIEGAKKIYDAYLLDKKDTVNLYYAASSYVNGKDYVTALKLYNDLKVLNYSGIGISYLAMNKLSNVEDTFNTSKERDLAIKIGTHEKPRQEAITSKRGEIYKNIALILVEEGKVDEAKKAITDARKTNPEDVSLILTEADLYLKTNDFDTYSKLISEVLEKNPTDPDLLFNLGVVSFNAKKYEESEKYYKKVIEINPDYLNAYINLSALSLENEKPIIEEMNKLGTSPADMKKYNVLKTKREAVFKNTIPFLKRASELDPKNVEVSKTLLNVYSALEMMPEHKALKEKIKALETTK